jgi:hypothetical protein
MALLKLGDNVIDVPENKVAYWQHLGYARVEEPVKPTEESKKKNVLETWEDRKSK